MIGVSHKRGILGNCRNVQILQVRLDLWGLLEIEIQDSNLHQSVRIQELKNVWFGFQPPFGSADFHTTSSSSLKSVAENGVASQGHLRV
jgi:hypothetical protein